jgi:hypothetical protein
MPYAPGPLSLFNAADLQTAEVDYGFTDFTIGALGDLDSLGADIDDQLVTIDNFAGEPSDPLAGTDFDNVLTVIAIGISGAKLPDLSAIDDAITVGDGLLSTATGFAPAQAWQDPGGPFEIPSSATSLPVPQVPAGAFSPTTSVPVGTTPPVSSQLIALYNLTRIGQPNFVVGDQFQLSAVGKPGDAVEVDAVFNGQDLGRTLYGQIGSDKTFTLTGTQGPEAVGAWKEDWYLGGVFVATFNFVVLPAD